ncbi:hypothetical protein BCR32DRAFT_291588 [Anaeromyces robustus]|uniref:Snurportin-1 n=1 Tax=Anaeromyces robustus TaxID=1754192 RepID=A0A1Y1XFE0_9FUNG|nr:hypothetical protein BCR32DRAFT_291588 [Anaeromyces robustus]|eukprot:ORX84094.1 hypothetical protein BCR32DRAFT_291588 [Anaeromyces robustus]
MDSFNFTFTAENKENDKENNTSFRKKDYKVTPFTKTREEKQEERRRKILEEQRQKRNSLVNQARRLIEFSLQKDNIESDSDSDILQNNISDNEIYEKNENDNKKMDIDKKKKKNKRNKKKINKFKNQLMISEKLIEIPEDFKTNWIAVKIPDGISCLVISFNGITISRRNDGTILEKFYSNIPGGSPLSKDFQNYSILDCIYNDDIKAYYVKDIMCWKGYPTYDCEAEFRFFWIQTKLSEIDLKTCNRYNQYPFLPLMSCYCIPKDLGQYLSNDLNLIIPNNIVGPIKPPSMILFYNKESHYILGSTPLCCHLSIDEAKILFKDFCNSMEL